MLELKNMAKSRAAELFSRHFFRQKFP